eukprot:COSAG05_NODE_12189_length_479_cov_0.863158_1_plen_139_part_10
MSDKRDILTVLAPRADGGITFSMWDDDSGPNAVDPLDGSPISPEKKKADAPPERKRRGSVTGVQPGEGRFSGDFPGVELSKDDFTHGGVLGKGSFGLVTHIRHKGSGKFYAMKAMSKQSLIEMEQVPSAPSPISILDAP